MTGTTDVATDITTLAKRLKRLEDREQIWELFMSYRRSLDQRDFAAYARLFAEDGEWIGGLGRAKGPAAIQALLERTLEVYPDDSSRTYHLVTNPSIELDGDRAEAETTWCFITRDDSDQAVLSLVGHYRDVLTREDGRWKFYQRRAFTDIPYRAPDS